MRSERRERCLPVRHLSECRRVTVAEQIFKTCPKIMEYHHVEFIAARHSGEHLRRRISRVPLAGPLRMLRRAPISRSFLFGPPYRVFISIWGYYGYGTWPHGFNLSLTLLLVAGFIIQSGANCEIKAIFPRGNKGSKTHLMIGRKVLR